MVVLIGAPLRLAWIDSYPPGLFYDPAGEGVDALRVLHGERPVFLPENNGREPLLNYLMAAVFAFTGPTVGGLRLTVALIGLASLPIAFLWARAWFGPRVALLTTALMAASTWHLFLSRFGVRAVLLPLVEALAIYLVWRAARRGGYLTWAAAGLVIGLGAYTYLPIRLFPIVVAGSTLGAIWMRRRASLRHGPTTVGHPATRVRELAGGIALMVGVAVLVALPLVLYFARNPADLNARVSQVSLLDDRDALRQVGDALLKTLGMFVVRGDAFVYTNLPGRPVFDLLVAPFFLLGLVVAVRRIRRLPYALLLLWLVVMLAPGVLTIGAPNFQRTAGLIPAIFVLPALGLTTATAWLVKRVQRRSTFVPALVVAASAALTAHAYFVELPRVPDLGVWYETDVAALGRRARSLTSETQVFAVLADLPDTAWENHNHGTLNFLGARRVHAFAAELMPIADTARRPATYLFPGLREAGARAALPPGHEEPLTDPHDGSPMLALHVPRGAGFEPQEPRDITWPNGARLLGWTVQERPSGRAGAAQLPSEIILYWTGPAVTETPADGRLVISLHDGDGRGRDLVRPPARGLFCPPHACGELAAVARRVFLSPAANAKPPLALRLRMVADEGSIVEGVNADGHKVGPSVRLWRSTRD